MNTTWMSRKRAVHFSEYLWKKIIISNDKKKRAMQFSEYLWKKKQQKKTHKFIVSNTKHTEKKIVYGFRK